MSEKGRSGGGVGGYEMEMGGEFQLEMDKVENVMEMVTQKGAGEYGDKKVRRRWIVPNLQMREKMKDSLT